jgi:predicted aspartyl protease
MSRDGARGPARRRRAAALKARATLALAACALAISARADEPSPEAVLAELPFLAAGPNQVRVDLGTPGARPLPLLLDTGAFHSFASAGAARALGIPLRRDKQGAYRRHTRLGRDVELYVDTRRGDTSETSEGDYALAGAPFLSRYVLELDFPGRRVRFLDPERYRVPDPDPLAVVLPLRRPADRPVVEIEVGGARVPALLATGAPGTLILPGGWAQAAGDSVRSDAAASAALALPPGSGGMEAAVAARVALGSFEETEVPILVAPRGLWDAGPRSEALLGVDFLKRFVLRIDYPRARVWIRDVAPPPGR